MVLDDGRMAVPYWARQARHNEAYYSGGTFDRHSLIGWAIWAKDRIGGLRADDYGCFSLAGCLVEGGSLCINYATEPGGWIRAALYEDLPHPPQKTQPLEGYDFEDCDTLIGDESERKVSWQGSTNLSKFAGKKLTVRFEMMRATLFAWTLGRPGHVS